MTTERTPWEGAPVRPRAWQAEALPLVVDAIWLLLVRLDRPVQLDELVSLAALPRWRVLLALRAQPERLEELTASRWRATKLARKR